jgi:hypothetical protein
MEKLLCEMGFCRREPSLLFATAPGPQETQLRLVRLKPLLTCCSSRNRARLIPRSGLVQSALCSSLQDAEFERDLIRERTGAGRKAAKKRGVLFGRPPKLIPDQRQLARRLVSEGKSVREIASVFNVHAATIYRLAYSKTGMAN